LSDFLPSNTPILSFQNLTKEFRLVGQKIDLCPLRSLLLCACFGCLWFFSIPPAVAQCVGHAQLNAYERAQFVQVSLGHREDVYVQFLSEAGCGNQMLDGLRGLGAKVDFADEKAGYALVTISRGKLLDTLDLPGIQYAYTRDDDRNYYRDPAAKIAPSDRKPEPVPSIAIPYPHVATTLPPDGPYFASKEIGLNDLREQHSEADGRGTRVGVADEGLDLLHPALEEARDSDGTVVPKVADLDTLGWPEEDSSWIRFDDPIQTKSGTFEAAGRMWTAPQDGLYRFGIFHQDLVLGPENNSLAKKLSISVGVLWDEQAGRVWVDTDGDGSFKNQRALGDYGVTHDVDWFGTKEGESDNRIPFGIKIDTTREAVYLRIGGEHGNLVTGPLSANRLTGGLYDGTAPGAQVVDEGLTRTTLLASIVKMFARNDIDVVNRSGGLGRAGYTGDRAGIEDFAQRVVEPMISVYRKPIATYSAATGTIHVNDFAGAEMLRRNRQLGPPYKETINSFVWFLPNGLVNVVLAPSANLETDSRYKPQDMLFPDGRRYMWDEGKKNPPAPDGYVIGANNSPTIPVVSGLLADLISEAKREHVRYDVDRLNNSVFTGARLLEGFPASEQGYGLVNAAQSWDQLSKMANADDPSNPELTSFTVSRADGDKTINVQGFQADLVKAGASLRDELVITRHGGYAGSRLYTFALRGNDGSFTLLDRGAALVQGKPARVRFRTNGAAGWHIAFLELRDAKAGVVMQDVPLSVRVPEVPEKIAPGVDRYKSIIEPLRSERRYPWVGDDVQAARYVMRIPYTGPENISTRGFPGGRYRDTKEPPGEPVDAVHHVGPMETLESLVRNDEPGTQEVFRENRGRPEYATVYDGPAPDVPIHAELSISKYAVGIRKSGERSLTISNKLAEVEGRVELYDATLRRGFLNGTGLHGAGEVERALPANLAEWRVRVTSGSSLSGAADAFLLDCSGKEGCSVAAQQEISAASKTMVIDKPQAGSWKIVVRSRAQVSGGQSYQISEALLISSPVGIETSDSKYASGASWSVSLPRKGSDAQYSAFRIAGTLGNEHEKNGLVVAMTPLEAEAP
jgi:hypothetical protein